MTRSKVKVKVTSRSKLTPSMKNSYGKKIVELCSSNPEILWLIYMGGNCREANIRTVLVIGHSLGGSSIASLQVSKKYTVAQCLCRAGYTLGSAPLSSIAYAKSL